MERRILILAPRGRDGPVMAELLRREGETVELCPSLTALTDGMNASAAAAIVAEEALVPDDMGAIDSWLARQPAWSDFPFVVLGNGSRTVRSPRALSTLDRLGNVILLERPLHAEGLLRAIRAAVGARKRQYEARARMEELHDSEAKFRAITESMPQIVWSTLPDGFHDFYNERWYEFTGMPHGSTDGEGWNEIFHPDDQERAWATWRQSLATGEDYNIEYRLRHAGGGYRWVLGRATPIRDDHGEITRWMGTCTDIQEIVEAREALARSREQLTDLVSSRTAELESALDSLRGEVAERQRAEEALHQSQKLETLGQLTGGIAHDFNNLLTPIVGSLDLLRRKYGADERSERLIAGALQAAERSRVLVQRLLAFARRQALQPQAVDLAGLVEGMRDLISRSIGPTIAIETDTPAGLPSVLVDPNQLELALLNLAVNARDAMPDGGTLRISVDRPAANPAKAGRFVRLSVNDTGVGMDHATLSRAVEPFFSTKGVGKGTGLGLSMVHGLAAQSGGGLDIDSTLGGGTRAHLWLPEADHTAKVATPEETTNEAPARGLRVLLVDDEELVRSATAAMLTEIGHEVVQTGSGAEALAMLDEPNTFDLLVTDYLMPSMTGAQLGARVREVQPGLPILLITGYASQTEAASPAALPRLTKPFRQRALAAAVERAVEVGAHAG